MGLFGGFFNYDKPGPGIDKNAPKKASFIVFFETWFRNIWKLVLPSVVYYLLCVLVLPFGLANVGITNISRNLSRDKHSFGISDFFTTIKKNWKQALPIGIINVIVTALLLFGIYFYTRFEGTMSTIFAAFSIAMFIFFSMMKYYIWTIVITFKLKTMDVYKNSFYLTFLNLKKNILIGIISILFFALMFGIWYMCGYDLYVLTVILLFILCFYPGFKNLLVQFCTFDAVNKYMIEPYYKANPGADIELRRSLGLEIYEETEEETEEVFSDETQNSDE